MTTPFPLQEWLGFSIERGEGSAVAALTLDARHLNPNGIPHGAVPFTLMDTAMGAAVMTVVEPPNLCATIEMHTRFHATARGDELRAEATVLAAGRRIIHLEARTLDGLGRLVASATASFAVLEPPGPA
jgi:acyl-CoA thioesterase